MELVFIHGANGTSQSWNYLVPFFADYKMTFVEYDSFGKFKDNLKLQEQQLANKKSIFFIGHSMGGIYAFYLQALLKNVIGGLTIAAPYGGSAISTTLKLFFPLHPLWIDSGVHSTTIKNLINIPMHHNWHQIVCTTHRTSYPFEENDGLITKNSQTKLNGVNYIDMTDNHNEVLLNKKVVNIVRGILNDTKKSNK